ncbi:hypothetical protein Hanom_Chr14g01317991 [Helianthus anomalus]
MTNPSYHCIYRYFFHKLLHLRHLVNWLGYLISLKWPQFDLLFHFPFFPISS